MDYDLEIQRIIDTIKEKQAKTVCLQFPDGLKPRAKEVMDKLEEETDAKIIIWGGSNYGACDLAKVDADLLVHFGHSKWI